MFFKEQEGHLYDEWEWSIDGPLTRWDRDEEHAIRHWIDIYSYPGDGVCRSMGQYHLMHVLTLLRSLNVKTANEEASFRGWN